MHKYRINIKYVTMGSHLQSYILMIVSYVYIIIIVNYKMYWIKY